MITREVGGAGLSFTERGEAVVKAHACPGRGGGQTEESPAAAVE